MRDNSVKRYAFMGVVFSLFTILFFLLYYFKLISNMDLYLAVTYVCYFAGLAMLYNGAYNRSLEHTKSTVASFSLGVGFVVASIVLLIYGIVTGTIVLF